MSIAEEIEEKSGDTLEAFKLECELEDEIVTAREDLWRITEERRKAEKLEVKAKKAKSERLAAEKRHEEQEKKFQHIYIYIFINSIYCKPALISA